MEHLSILFQDTKPSGPIWWILLTSEVFHQKWNQFSDLVGIPKEDRLGLSNGWLGCFKDRNGLEEMKWHGEAASEKTYTVEDESKQVQVLIKEHRYELHDIFNMDETGLSWAYVPSTHFQAHISLCYVEWHQTKNYLIVNNLVSKVKNTGWHMHSLQMLMDQRNSHHL